MLVGAIFANGGLEMGLANRVQANGVQANGAWKRGVLQMERLQMERLQIGRLRNFKKCHVVCDTWFLRLDKAVGGKENGGWRKVNTFQGLTKPFESVILILSYG
jgi:hypothetical protein